MQRVLAILMAIAGLAMGGCTNNTPALELSGTLHLKGSMPHPYLVLEEEHTHTNYKVINAGAMGLLEKQNHHVRIKAKLLREAKGPGFPAEVKAIEVEK